MAARTWFTDKTCPDLASEDRRVLNIAARIAFPGRMEPRHLDLVTLRTTYQRGMSANALLAASGLAA